MNCEHSWTTEDNHYRCTKCNEIVPKATPVPTIAKDW